MAISEKNIRNIFIYAVPRFLGYGLHLVTLPILTRLLTPQDFGIVAMAWLFPTIAVSILTCGLASAAQRYYFEYRADSKKLNAFVFSSQVFLYAVFLLSACFVFSYKDSIAALTIKDSSYGMALFLIFIAAFLGQVNNFYLYLYQNMEKAVIHSIFTVIQSVVIAATGVILVWAFKFSFMGIIYGSLIGTAAAWVGMFFHFNRGIKVTFNIRILGENILYGLQVVTKAFTSFVNRFFDKYMIVNMLSLSAVGIYNIGQTIGTTMFYLMNTVWLSFQPVCYREVFDKGKDASGTVGRIFSIFSYLTLIPLFFLILFAEELVMLIAPASYFAAIDIIIIICAGIATQTFGMYVAVQYAYAKKAYLIFPISVVSTIVNVVLNIFLIPRWGIIGAGISMSVTYLVLNGVLAFVGQRLYRIQYQYKTVMSMLITVLFSATVVLLLRRFNLYGGKLYIIKLSFIVLFLLVGIHGKIVTRSALGKLKNAFGI